jgi:hypothetical protein
LAQEIRDWLSVTKACHTVTECDTELGIVTNRDKTNRRKIYQRLVEEGIIARIEDRPGTFRVIERESNSLDFMSADTGTVIPFKWPFELETLVNIYPKNLIVIAGTSNAGKTAFLLDFIRLNMAQFKINYFSSEMSPEELRLRLEKFDMALSEWRFKPYERTSNFADAVISDAVNIIDYLELTDNFYKVAGELKAIFDKLTTGIAIVAIQKKQGAALGRGGDFSLEKARLYLSMEGNELKIVKAKNYAKANYNPNGLTIGFHLVSGAKFIESYRTKS